MRARAYEHIKAKIASRALPPGSPVAELPIAREAGISRTPAREAMRQLIAEGLLREVPGRGVIVTRLDRQDLLDLYDLREALETHAVRSLADAGLSGDDLAAVKKVAAELRDLAAELKRSRRERLNGSQMERFESSDIGFHMLLLRLAGNRRSVAAVNETREMIRLYARRHEGHTLDSLGRVHRDHEAMVRAIARREPEAAVKAVRTHIQNSRRERLEQFDRWEREQALAGIYRPLSAAG